jgi:hypothetical protein
MSDEVTLINRSRRTHVINLDHEAFRTKRWGFEIQKGITIEENNAGVRTERPTRRAIPGSITLFPGGRIEGLHPAIVKVPQVVALLRSRPPQVAVETPTIPDSPQEESERATLASKQRHHVKKKSEG